MAEGQRVSRSRAKPEHSGANGGAEPAGTTSARSPAAEWAAAQLGSAFPLAGVQRKVDIGPAGDAYEREADRVSADVASGRTIAPSAISPIGSLPSPVGQRAPAAPETDKKPEKKKDEKPAAPVQKADKPDDKKKEEKPKTPAVQKADKPDDKKKEEKPKTPAVQKADKPDDKKKEEKPKTPAVQKADKPDDKKKEEKPKTPAVQKADKPDDKKKEEKPKTPAVQKADKPDDKKKEEKPKTPAVQKADKPDDKKKEEKPKTPAVQKADKPDDKKKEEKPKTPAVQKADKPDDKKKEEKPKTPAVQKADKPDDKKKEEKPKTPAVQKADKPDDKKKEEKPAAGPVQKAATSDAPAAAATPKEKDKKEAKEKTLDEKLSTAPVQKADAPKAPLEKEKKKEESKEAAAVQRASGAGTPTPSMENAAASAINSKGAGEPINSPTRNALESRMGVDLGGVRVHQDRRAQETSDAINARAFTHGNDIWLGRNQSQSDTALMAHEATHVVQQAGGVHRMLVQRAPKKGKGKSEDPPGGKVEGKTVTIFDLQIPTVKGQFKPATEGSYTFKKPEERKDQRAFWRTQLEAGVKAALPAKLQPLPGIVKGDKGAEAAKPNELNKTVFLQMKGGEGGKSYLFGTAAELADEFVIPRWGPNGNARPLDVDHQTELQLGGAAESMENLWLLDASANRSSGAKISNEIRRKITSATEEEVEKGTWAATPTLNELIAQGYTVFAEKITANQKVAGEEDTFWKEESIKGIDKPLAALKSLTLQEAIAAHLVGKDSQLLIYPLPTGGKPRPFAWDVNKDEKTYDDDKFLKGYKLTKIKYKLGAADNRVEGTFFPNPKNKKTVPKPFALPMGLVDLQGLPYTATINAGALRQGMKFAVLQGLSPIEFQEVGLGDEGLMARGKLKPSLPMFKDLEIDILVTGEDITLSKTFTKDEFNLPGPIKVTGASLTVSVGTSELAVSGDVFFQIERVGKGQLSGKVGTAGGLEVKGTFNFDTELFDPAEVTVGYAEGKFSGEGKLGVKEGKVRGIKSATLTASFDGDKIDATGSVKPSIPGVEQGDLKFSYDPATGVVISGKLELKKDIPGLEGGSVTATLAKPPGSDKWKVTATGEATPKIPGVSSKLVVTYDDGAFDAVVTAGYEKGMVKGSITVGATNRPVGDDGKPAGPPPEKGDKVTIYGGGSVTLKLAPWLQATAGIKLLPNGEIEVTGEIGLPAALEIFKEKKLDKNIFKIGIDIPIVGVAVAGQRIGIFANITGGLDLSAGIGPAELNQLKLGVKYNPAHEDQTTVTGDANLHIPAHAGLRLFVRGSVGVGIPIVSMSAGLEIGGSLGLEGALDAGVHVDWSPSKGLDLTAQASIYVEPKLKFDITGFVLVEADLWITTVELYSKKWQLASFEYGSGLRFGLKFPIHYQEGHEFNISLSDVEFEVPKVDPGELLSGLLKKIA